MERKLMVFNPEEEDDDDEDDGDIIVNLTKKNL